MPAARRKTTTKTMPGLDRLRRTSATVEATGLSRTSLYRLASQGLLTRYKLGGSTYWDIREIESLVRRATPSGGDVA